MDRGDTVVLRATDEHVRILAIVDAAGTLLVAHDGEEPFQAQRDEVEPTWAKHKGCGCCG